MCLFKRQTAHDFIRKQNDIIQKSLTKINLLIVKLEKKNDICNELKEAYNKYSNVTANGNSASIIIDKKIESILSDIELEINKAEKSNNFTTINNLVKDLKLALVERHAW